MAQKKAVALISGGLDSMLAAKTMLEQGIHVEGLNFYTGFCVEGHTHAIRQKDKTKNKRNNALWVAETLGIKLHIIDIVEEYKSVLLNPKHGYGANLNPCLDCKVFMVREARVWLEQHQFDFIITGEVLGQRPMSQRKHALPLVAKRSGAEDIILRPLSAKNLPPTLPEREGWVNREKLHGFTGRSRKPQIALAKNWNISEYAQPAGGCCFLTNEHYTNKLKDLWRSRNTRDYELDDILLLKVGRHIRPKDNFKLIIGREEGENNYLKGYQYQFMSLQTISHFGPLTLIDGNPSFEDIQLAAQITARFSQGHDADEVVLEQRNIDGTSKEIRVQPLTKESIPPSWYVEAKHKKF